LPIPDESQNSKSKPFTVNYQVRGRRKRQPLTSRCNTVEEIIDFGKRSFPAFTERNPWICIDSKHATVFVGLDPQSQSRKASIIGDDALRNDMSSEMESIQQ
jgi:hypothetical protein